MANIDDDSPTGIINPDDTPNEAGYDSGDNAEVSTTAFVHDPVLAKYQTPDYQEKWNKELEASRKERKRFVTKGYKILEHWADVRPNSNTRSNYNLLFANTELKLAALYARSPAPDIKRRFSDPNDQVSRVAALILTRKLMTELDEEDFDSTAKCILMDRILPGIGIGWLRLEQEGGEDLAHPETGAIVGQSPVTSQCTPIDHVSWDDFYWSPCRTWKLCRWVARHIPMSKQAIEDRFGHCAPASALSMLSYDSQSEEGKGTQDQDRLRTKNALEDTTSVYEIWDKELKLVWWIAEAADVPLDVQQDTNQFPGFFPTPRCPLGRFDGSNTIPHPDYHFAQDLYKQADELNDRASKMIQAAQLKFVYDSANPQLKDLLTTTSEFGGIGVDNWASFVSEKGGLKNALQFLPIEEMVNSAKVLTQSLELVSEQILKIEGLAGPFQAESAPNETNLQTQQKAAFGTSRLSITQKDVAKYFQELLRLKAHLICKFYTPEQIMQGTGTLTPEDQKLIPQALQLLRNEQMRNFDLSVSVDSIQLENWNLEKQDKVEAFKAITGALQQVLPAVQQNPLLAPLSLKTIGWLLTGFKGAQYMEGEIDSLLAQLAQAQQQKMQQPPKPNPAELKAQTASERAKADIQIAQMQEQTKRQDNAATNQVDMARLELDQKQQQIEAAKLSLDAHNDERDTIHNHAMDLMDTQAPREQPSSNKGSDLTIVIGGPR